MAEGPLTIRNTDQAQASADRLFVFRLRTGSRVFPLCPRINEDDPGSCVEVPILVMIVDDHAIIRRMLRTMLEAESLVVSDAADGAEGVQKA